MEVIEQERDVEVSLLPVRVVEGRVGLKKSSIYAGVKDGTFPAPIALSSKKNVWRSDQIQTWINERIRGSLIAEHRGGLA